MIKAIIFDMDGVIIDSNSLHYNAWNSLFKTKFNVEIEKDFFASQLGKRAEHFTQALLDKYNIKGEDPNFLFKDKADFFNNYFDNLKLKHGVLESLNRIRDGYKIALATGGKRFFVNFLFNKFDLQKYFDFTITGDDVEHAKPNPEIFLKVAEKFLLQPEECLVIEDAQMGLEAAKSAKMHCIVIPDELTKSQDFSKADKILSSLDELSLDVINLIK